jgi:hypothetical protein
MVKEARELVQSGALGTILGPCLWINERSISKSTLGAPSRERINRWYVQYPPTARATAVATDDMHTKRSGDIGVFIKISVVLLQRFDPKLHTPTFPLFTHYILCFFVGPQSQKDGLTQLVIVRPLGELNLREQHGFDPVAAFHDCRGDA